ncbi:MAG: EAL domain-containing protein [Butyrivibrio sp.]|nr:EAL domain-containing protein [Butyrivibrio sp.]
MEIRTPIIAIFVLVILMFIYIRKNIPQLSSSRMFYLFLVLAIFNVVTEILECVVFLYMDNVFYKVRGLVQIFYVATLMLTAYALCLYTYSKFTSKRGVSLSFIIIHAIPMLIGIALTLIFGVTFGRTIDGHYFTSGSTIPLCYALCLLYPFISGVLAIVHRGRVKKEDFHAILLAHAVWCLTVAFQFVRKDSQVSSVAIMLTALIIYIATENPKEYYEKYMPGVRTKDAFISMLAERFARHKSFYIVSVIFRGKTNLLTGSDRRELENIQKKIAELAQSEFGLNAYLSNWNTLSFITKSTELVEKSMAVINGYKDDEVVNYRLTFTVLEVPVVVRELDKAIQVLSYVSGEYVYTQSSPNLVIDENIVDKMVYRNTIEDVVRQAVKDKSFEVYYQPILSVTEGTFSSAEALVRLKKENSETFISPEDFIPVAEKCGLVQEIDDFVFEKVCSFIARENLSSYGIKTVEVNLSGNEVVDEHTHERLIRKMEKYHIPPKYINFEITETSYINDDETFKENFRKLREKGSTFSMDDFGSGYSNLLEILKMDYVLVKLDKEFVWNCLDADKPENLKMLKYTIKFLKDYGLHILAEGVETLEQAKTLIDNGVEFLQGFYYSRPIPEDEYLEFLKTQKGLVQKSNS